MTNLLFCVITYLFGNRNTFSRTSILCPTNSLPPSVLHHVRTKCILCWRWEHMFHRVVLVSAFIFLKHLRSTARELLKCSRMLCKRVPCMRSRPHGASHRLRMPDSVSSTPKKLRATHQKQQRKTSSRNSSMNSEHHCAVFC